MSGPWVRLARVLVAGVLLAAVLLRPGSSQIARAADTRTTSATPGMPATSAAAAYSAAGLYNLANAYARAGKPGLAMLNYERARLLAPADPDVEANERHVRDSLHLATESPTRFQRA